MKDISLELDFGQILLLTGVNGAGKTTLIKIMAGLIRPDAGSVVLDLEEGAHLAYLGHQTFLYPALSGLENLLFWNRMYGLGQNRAVLLALLDRVHLAAFAEEKAGTFSRGMAQRLNLARVLLIRPALILLDEPTTGLDTRSRKLLDEEIRQAGKAGAGIVWISHRPEEDAASSDRVALLAGGRLSFGGAA